MLRDAISSVSALIVPLYLLSATPGSAQEIEPLPVEIVSEGAAMQAGFYYAECTTVCPTLLLVPGFPGSAQLDVLGLGPRLSNGGIHVLVVNPRGLYQSEGTMSFFNTLEDVAAALGWLRSETAVNRFAVDTSAVVVGGYSFGGGMALAYAARDPSVRAIVSIAGTDHGAFIRLFRQDTAFAERIGGFLQSTLAPDGPARFDYEGTLRELDENQNVFGLRENASRLADRPILLVGGWDDPNVTIEGHVLPLYRALQGAEAEDVSLLVYQDGHGFGDVRERLAAELHAWLLDATGNKE